MDGADAGLPRLLATLAVLLFMVGIGCSGRPGDQPKLAPVTGRILMDGEPLNKKEVIFQPEGAGRPSMGLTNENGEYRMMYTPEWEGAILGSHKVAITTPRNSMEGEGWREDVPLKYNGETVLKADVKDTNNVIDFKLDTK